MNRDDLLRAQADSSLAQRLSQLFPAQEPASVRVHLNECQPKLRLDVFASPQEVLHRADDPRVV